MRTTFPDHCERGPAARAVGKAVCCAALAAVVLLTGAGVREARAQLGGEDVSSKTERLFREGVDLFEMGRWEQSRMKLREVLKLDPTTADAWRYVKMAGVKIVEQMLLEPRMVGREPRVIYELYILHSKRLQRDAERIKRMVAVTIDPREHPRKRWQIMERLTAVGQFVIPFLVDALGNERDDDVRAFARVTATRMGRHAALPVIQLLKYRDEGDPNSERAALIRENAAIILMNVDDKRALPALKRVAEDEEESPVIRKYALMALQKIAGLDVDDLRSAQDYYYLEADRYLRELAGVGSETTDSDAVIWQLEGGRLIDRQVPRFAWNELMAEQACYDCMAIDANYRLIYPLLAAVVASRIAECDELLDVALERPVGRPFTEEEVTDVKDILKKLLVDPLMLDGSGLINLSAPAIRVPRAPARRNLILGALGPRNIYEALDKCLDDAEQDKRELRALAACVLCDAAFALDPDGKLLPTPGQSGPTRKRGRGRGRDADATGVGAPLIRALRFDGDDRVRFAAAIALARMNPAERFDGADEVISALAEAIGKSGPLQVLIVEEDPSIRNELAGKLRDFDMGVAIARSAREGLARATSAPPLDLVLVSTKLEVDETSEWLIQSMQDNAVSRGIPVAIITSYAQREIDSAAFKDRESVKGFVPVEDMGKDLRDLIEKSASQRATPIMSKKRSEELSVAAAEALCQVHPHVARISGMDPDQAGPACIATLKNRSDAVRRPCIDALGRFRIMKAHDPLLEIARNSTEGLGLRVAAIRSVGMISPDADLSRLLELAEDAQLIYLMRALSAQGFGKGSPTPSQMKDFVEALRLPIDGKRIMVEGEGAGGGGF